MTTNLAIGTDSSPLDGTTSKLELGRILFLDVNSITSTEYMGLPAGVLGSKLDGDVFIMSWRMVAEADSLRA